MKIIGFRLLKNALFSFLKIVLICLFIFYSITLSLNCFNDIKLRYDNYTFVRGLQNYGVYTFADFNEDKSSENVIFYDYVVKDEIFSIKMDRNSVESIDKQVKIVYDIFSPEISIFETDSLKVNGFYETTLENICIVYLEIFMGVIILGLLWFILDCVKYNKLVWKEYV